MECSARKKKSKNLFKIALDKLVGKYVENVNNNDDDNKQANSADSIPMDNNHEQNIPNKRDNIEDEPHKMPRRRKSRPSSKNSFESFEIRSLFERENMNVKKITIDEPPTAPQRKRSCPGNQNSCKSFDLHTYSQRPTPPPASKEAYI